MNADDRIGKQEQGVVLFMQDPEELLFRCINYLENIKHKTLLQDTPISHYNFIHKINMPAVDYKEFLLGNKYFETYCTKYVEWSGLKITEDAFDTKVSVVAEDYLNLIMNSQLDVIEEPISTTNIIESAKETIIYTDHVTINNYNNPTMGDCDYAS